MMMVETELRMSPIHGIGVFLLEAVPKGGLIWRFDSRIDQVFSEDALASLPERTQKFMRMYSTYHSGVKLWVLCGDHGRHFNHSDKPSCISDGIAFGHDHAAHDLPAGTELTSDYHTICDTVRSGGVKF